jgi:large conductance mechanosensitive channel
MKFKPCFINPTKLKAPQQKNTLGINLANDNEMLEELRRIRKLLEPKPAPTPTPPKGLWAEFMDFISKYKIMGLAVGFIIGLYLGNLVQALVKDLILPTIGLAIPGMSDLASYTVKALSQIFGIGDFLVALITFIIVAFTIFLVVKITKKWGIE